MFVLTVAATGALGRLLIGLWRLAQADAFWRFRMFAPMFFKLL